MPGAAPAQERIVASAPVAMSSAPAPAHNPSPGMSFIPAAPKMNHPAPAPAPVKTPAKPAEQASAKAFVETPAENDSDVDHEAPAPIQPLRPEIEQLLSGRPVPDTHLKTHLNYTGAGLLPRAQQQLFRHAAPTGDVQTWPLDDVLFEQFQTAMKLRRPILGAAQLYRFLLVTCAILTVMCSGLVALNYYNKGQGWERLANRSLMGAFVSALAAGACWALWTYTRRSYRWPSAVFGLFWALITSFSVVGMVYAIAGSIDPYTLLASCPTIIIGVTFTSVGFRAATAAPKYLAQPAWCQEAIVAAGL
jgi:hypothetical protein